MRKKMYFKLILCVFLVAVLGFLCYAALRRSYFPMGGDVVVVDKGTNLFGYYIVVKQGPTLEGESSDFKLSCTREQYDSVDIGETVGIDRTQSAITHGGTVHRIKTGTES